MNIILATGIGISVLLSGCSTSLKTTPESPSVDTALQAPGKKKENKVANSMIFEDSSFLTFNPDYAEISENEYKEHEKKNTSACVIGEGGAIKGTNLSFLTDCDETCENLLTDNNSGKTLLLPSSFDSGISGFVFSPSCEKFIVFSSYDGTDYDKYYSHRSEIRGFTFNGSKNLEDVRPSLKINSKEWSLEDLIWADENTVLLKVYEEDRSGAGESLHYKYLKASISK
jgi:hypothetical protein